MLSAVFAFQTASVHAKGNKSSRMKCYAEPESKSLFHVLSESQTQL